MKAIFALSLSWAIVSFSAAFAEDNPVKITKRAPEQTLGSDGLPNGVCMSTPGTSMTFVRMNGDQLVLKGADGALYVISVTATDYTPPATAPKPVPTVPAASPASSSPAVTAVSPASPTPAPAGDATAQKLSTAFGVPLFADAHFWGDSVADAARRLKSLEPASKTGNEVFYDIIQAGKSSTILNCPCYGMGLEGRNGAPTYVTFLFLNMVQSPDAQNRLEPSDDEIKEVNQTVTRNIAADQEMISDALSAVLGQPSVRNAGLAGENGREVRRWNWEDVAFLLSCRPGAYLFMEIMPVKEANRIETGTAPTPDSAADKFAKRVAHAPNGDVSLNDVPETSEYPLVGENDMTQWQRYLHYMDVPGDAYILGVMEGHSFTKFGTNWNASMARSALNDYLSAYHCHVEAIKDFVTLDLVENSIDQGVPLIWTGFLIGEDEQNAHAHAAARQGEFDVDTYTAQLEKEDLDRARVKTTPQAPDSDAGTLLVVGYNKDTQEVALQGLSSGGKSPLMWVTIRTMKRIAPQGLRRLNWESESE